MSLYVFDMDGVLWTMDDPIPHASEVIARLQARGDQIYYLTNNSSKTRQDYVEKLARFGISATQETVMTSAYATAQILRAEGHAGKSVYVVGEQGLRRELEAVGMRLVEYDEGDRVDFVVVGWDREFTYRKLALAHAAIVRGGAAFIATNRDATYPDAGGRTLPGGGALVAAIQTCTGVAPRTIGKPEPHTLQLILRATGAAPHTCLVIGDRLDTDIALGKRVGARTALALTGVTSREDVEAAAPEQRPDLILRDLSELP
jgi:phosphoglycolate/pyridoxal phosphate phosphatase family enzyme